MSPIENANKKRTRTFSKMSFQSSDQRFRRLVKLNASDKLNIDGREDVIVNGIPNPKSLLAFSLFDSKTEEIEHFENEINDWCHTPAPLSASRHIDVGSSVSVRITHVVRPDLFFVNLTNSSIINAIEEKLKAYETSSFSQRVTSPKKNNLCVVQLKGRRYYRAVITSVLSSEEVTIRCIDIGYTKRQRSRYLYFITPDLALIDMQAIPCRLADVAPNEAPSWTLDSIKYFKEILDGSDNETFFSMNVHGFDENRVASVVLQKFDGRSKSVNINRNLILKGYATSTGTLSSSSEKAVVHQPGNSDTITVELARALKSKDLIYSILHDITKQNNILKFSDIDSLISVTVSHVITPDQFYVRLTIPEMANFVNLVEEHLNSVVSDETHKHLHICFGTGALELNEICVYNVVNEDDVQWRRSKVIEHFVDETNEDNYRLFSLDFGETVTRRRQDILKLHPNSIFAHSFALCIQCHLEDLKPAAAFSWTNSALDSFKSFVSDNRNNIFVHVKDTLPSVKPYSVGVNLVVKKTTINPLEKDTIVYETANTYLLNEGLAVPLMRCNRDDLNNVFDFVDRLNSGSENYVCSRILPFSLSTKNSFLTQMKKCHRLQDGITVATNNSYLPVEFPTSQVFEAEICEVDEDLNIYFRLRDGLFEKVNHSIAKELVKKHSLNAFAGTIAVKRICTAYSDSTRTWNRAEIEDIVRDETSKSVYLRVRYVDSGIVDHVFSEKISSDVFFLEIPKLALCGRLHNCQPLNLKRSLDVYTKLRALLLNKVVSINWESYQFCTWPLKISIDIPDLGSVKNIMMNSGLMVETRDNNLPGKIVHLLNSLRRSKYKECNLQFLPDTFYTVAISQHLLFNYIFLQADEVKTPTTKQDDLINGQHDMFFATINKINKDSELFDVEVEIVEDFNVGDAVLAPYNDGSWYRGLVTQKNGDVADVLYVDYGNSEKIDIGTLKKIDPLCVHRPPVHAFVAKMWNIRPSKGKLWSNQHSKLIAKELVDAQLRANILAVFRTTTAPFEVDLFETNNDSPHLPRRHALQNLVNQGVLEYVEPVITNNLTRNWHWSSRLYRSK